jgi:hypothetical protein
LFVRENELPSVIDFTGLSGPTTRVEPTDATDSVSAVERNPPESPTLSQKIDAKIVLLE